MNGLISVTGVILARAGSKRIKLKNLRLVAGKPLVLWTIEAALASRSLSRLIVSTDDSQVAEIAGKAGAEVPFARPPELATDFVPSIDVVLHAAAWEAETQRGGSDYMMCLHATSPLRTPDDIDRSIDLAQAKHADSVIGVSQADVTNHPLRALRSRENGTIASWIENDLERAMGQELPQALRPNGAILLGRTSFLTVSRGWIGERTYPFIMPAERSVDIDSELDLRIAELLLTSRETIALAAHIPSHTPERTASRIRNVRI